MDLELELVLLSALRSSRKGNPYNAYLFINLLRIWYEPLHDKKVDSFGASLDTSIESFSRQARGHWIQIVRITFDPIRNGLINNACSSIKSIHN